MFACQLCLLNSSLEKRKLLLLVIYFLLEELKTFHVLNICSIQCAKRSTWSTELVLLSGHKFNKMNRPVGGWKGSAVHSLGQGSSSQTSVLKSNHWHKALDEYFSLCSGLGGFHSLGERDPFIMRLEIKLIFLSFMGIFQRANTSNFRCWTLQCYQMGFST